ncbi:MAG: chemotaxis protein CheW [Gammaproteobacteria bacterium]
MTTVHDELYSLLVPLHQERLIVPRACVAEVVRYAPLQTDEAVPPWFRGRINWNGRQVPVISFEELAGLTPAEPGGRTRVAILSAIGGRLSSGFFGVLTEGFPQLVRVNREVVQPAARQVWPENGPVICQIRMINEYPLIPDLEAIESLIEDALNPSEELLS